MTLFDSLVADRQSDWKADLAAVVAMMREMSVHTDPQAMVAGYRERLRKLLPADGFLAISRRELVAPMFRVTRSSTWSEDINPWREPHRLPLLSGGILAELIYGEEPRVLDDFQVRPDDPAEPYLRDARCLVAVPNYEQGTALNMNFLLFSEPGGFQPERLPGYVWMSNLFGRATHSLVLSRDLRRALDIVDRELRSVADLQRSLLPRTIPKVPHIEFATHYQTSRWAGGDYYDFFPTVDGRLGILVADVSGHGTPAAVMMAITHALAHQQYELVEHPARFLETLNQRLYQKYTHDQEAFVTAIYGLYDPVDRTLTYSNAGHPAPRLKRCSDGSVGTLDGIGGLPLGIFEESQYGTASQSLVPGDQLVIYTDGVTDSVSPAGEYFGPAGLDRVLANCGVDATSLLEELQEQLTNFTGGIAQEDDQTILIARIV
jgi:sigma-B regulation protein RsbU (phosphoserine phosphatase)